jgi:hypothetical protein
MLTFSKKELTDSLFQEAASILHRLNLANTMSLSRAEKLINKLITNTLSGEELSELLEGITSEEEQQKYSDALEIYFNNLLKDNHPNGEAPEGK